MKRRSRWFGITMGIVLVFQVFVLNACGGQKAAPTQPSPTPAAPPPAPAQKMKVKMLIVSMFVPPFDKTLKEIMDEWAAKNNAEVTLEAIPVKDLETSVAKAIETGSADIIQVPRAGVTLYPGALVDVTKLATDLASKHGGFYPQAQDVGAIGDKWFSIPAYSYQQLLFYRTDLLAKIGEKPPQTWDDIARVSARLKAAFPDIIPFGQALGRSNDANQFLYSVIWSMGGKLVEKDGKTVALDSPGTIKALKWIQDLHSNGLIPEGTLGWDDAANNNIWMQGKIAMTLNTPSIPWKAKTDFPDIYKVTGSTIWPKGETGWHPTGIAYGYAIPKKSANQAAALSLLTYIFAKENYERLIIAGDGQAVPTLRSYASMPLWQGEWKPLIENAEHSKEVGWPGPMTKAAAQMYNEGVLLDLISNVVQKKQTPEQAVKVTAEQLKRIVADN